jgi:hypothetical protein
MFILLIFAFFIMAKIYVAFCAHLEGIRHE